MGPDPLALFAQLADERSRRVVFVSHCLLNQNTRYAGGAVRPGAVPEVVEPLLRDGVGICQLPCPEQRAWGGVAKRRLLPAYGSRGSLRYRLRRPLLRLFVWWTRLVYRRLARRVAREVADYRRSGFDVVGIVGVAGSPSCGVSTTLDLGRSFEVVSSCPVALLTRELMNRRAVLDCRRPGAGLFVRALERALARRDLAVPFSEPDVPVTRPAVGAGPSRSWPSSAAPTGSS